MPKNLELRVFLIHLAVYVAVSVVLIVLNLLMQTSPAGQPRAIWFQWPVIGWGIGVAAHGLALLMRRRAKPGSLLADERMRGFLVHAFVYVAVNILLIVLDLVTTPGTQWFWWPLLGWGAGLAAHGYAVWHATRQAPAPSAEAARKPDLKTETPWPKSSMTESPKTGAAAAPAGEESEPSKTAVAETSAAKPAQAEEKRETPQVTDEPARAEEAKPAPAEAKHAAAAAGEDAAPKADEAKAAAPASEATEAEDSKSAVPASEAPKAEDAVPAGETPKPQGKPPKTGDATPKAEDAAPKTAKRKSSTTKRAPAKKAARKKTSSKRAPRKKSPSAPKPPQA